MPFHGGNRGSIPRGRASDFNKLVPTILCQPWAYGKYTAYLSGNSGTKFSAGGSMTAERRADLLAATVSAIAPPGRSTAP